MAYELVRDEARGLTRLTISGVADLAQITEALRALRHLPGHDWRTLIIYASEVELKLSARDVRSLATLVRAERPPDAPAGRAAVVAPAPLVYGINRMYGGLSRDHPVNFRVFHSVEDACDWLSETLPG
jgi:hypothetical protein